MNFNIINWQTVILAPVKHSYWELNYWLLFSALLQMRDKIFL